MKTIFAVLFAAGIALGAEPVPQPKHHNVLYRMSVAFVVAASAADISTSMGRYETNPLLRGSNGEFGARGIALKSAIVGGSLGMQYLLRRHPGMQTAGMVSNFAMAGTFGYIAHRNTQFAKIGESR